MPKWAYVVYYGYGYLVMDLVGVSMTQEEHERWERWYWEAADRDFARMIYQQVDDEDRRRDDQDSEDTV